MTVAIIHGTPAQYEQVLVKAATKTTVEVELSLHDALVLACLEGGLAAYDSTAAVLYQALADHPRYHAYQTLREARAAGIRAGEHRLYDFSSLRADTEAGY